MARMETWLEQDLKKPLNVRMLTGNLFSMDNEGNLIGVTVLDGGEPATLGGSVSANVIRSDGGTVAVTGTLEDNQAYVILPQAAYAVPGLVTIIIKLTSSGVITTLAAMTAIVYRTSTATAIDPGTIIPSIQTLIDSIDTAVASIPADYSSLWTTLAPAFSSSTAYTAGQYVTNDGKMYRFIKDHAAGSWASGDVTEVKIGNDLSKLIDNTHNLWSYGDISGTKSVNKQFTFTAGQKYTLSAKITSTDTGDTSQILLTDSSAHSILGFYFKHDGTRQSVTFVAMANITRIYFYAANTSANSTGKTLSVSEIQIEKGELTPYVRYGLTADDLVARSQITGLDGRFIDFEEEIRESIGTYFKYDPIVPSAGTGYGSGKYWNCEGETAYTDSSANYYCYNPIPVKAGEIYQIQILKGSSSKQNPVLITDENYNILQQYNTGTGAAVNTYNVNVTAEDAAYMLLTTTTAGTGDTIVQKGSIALKDVGILFDGKYKYGGKTVAIIGDSISTNGNYDADTNPFGNVPEILIGADDVGVSLSAYVTFWDVWNNSEKTSATGLTLVIGGERRALDDSDIGTEITFVPEAQDVGKMVGKPLSYNPASTVVWWENAMEELGFTPIAVCWSGASMCSHEASKEKYKASYAWHPATIRKCGVRTPGSMTRTAPDMVIVYRGTNDFSHTPYATIDSTKINAYPGTYPTGDHTNNTNYFGFVEAMQITVKKIREAYPDALIVFCTLNVFKRINYSEYPTNNGTNTLPQYNQTIRETAEALGCYVIDFDRDGITFENCYSSGYITDSSTTPTHPSDKGHKAMGNRAILDLKKISSLS